MNHTQKYLLLTMLFFVITIRLEAQNSIAKIKYEQAEEAFEKNDFKTTLAKLDEVEKLLGSTNPKVLYLKIVAQSKHIKTDSLYNFTIVEKAMNDCDYYLKNYEQVSGIEEKYKEVFMVSELLAKYPKTNSEFILAIKNKRIQERKDEEQKWPKQFADKYYYNRSLAMSNEKVMRLPEAIEDCTEAIRINPNVFIYYYQRGIARYNNLEFAAAIKDFDKALSFKNIDYSSISILFFSRSFCKMNSGDMEGAREDMQKAITANATDTYQYWNAKLDILYGSRKKKSYKALEQIVNNNDDNIKHIIAVCHYLLGNKELAFEMANAIISKNPEQYSAYINTAKLYSFENNKQLTVNMIQKAIEKGYKGKLLTFDPDFLWLKDDPEFKALFVNE